MTSPKKKSSGYPIPDYYPGITRVGLKPGYILKSEKPTGNVSYYISG